MSYQLGYLGEYEELPEMAVCAYENNLKKLQELLQEGHSVDEVAQFSFRERYSLLEIAVIKNNLETAKFLLEQGARCSHAVYNYCVRFCDRKMILLFLEGMKNLPDTNKYELFSQILYGETYENIRVLDENGIPVSEYGGQAFRKVVSGGEMCLVELLIGMNVDVNFHQPDMVYPYASTPVMEAVRKNNFALVKYLVAQGADVTIEDADGRRPYTIALEDKNQELITYLKSLEPEEWHNRKEKEAFLKGFHLPKGMLEYLESGQLVFENRQNEFLKRLELLSYMDLTEIKFVKKKYLKVSLAVEQYPDAVVAWNARSKQVVYLDYEHEEETELGKWEVFVQEPLQIIEEKVFGKK